MNQALSTQIPQIGDSSQQLLARICDALADQTEDPAEVVWLASASRTTSQSLTLTVPPGARSILFYGDVTVVPGVSTLQLIINNQSANNLIFTHAESAVNSMSILLRPVKSFTASVSGTAYKDSAGFGKQISLFVIHSGAGAFTYNFKYQFLKT